MKRLLLAMYLLALAGCEGNANPVTPKTAYDEYHVGLLFEADGCRVYRFTDEYHSHYFASCQGQSSTISTVRCGKNCVREETIMAEVTNR